MDDSTKSFDRLERALEVFSLWEESGKQLSPQELLAAHEDLREVLEPLLEEDADEPPQDAASADPRSGAMFVDAPGPESEVPEQLGDFRIEGEIGRGGMGVVYAARQVALDRPVALKVLPIGSQIEPRAVARFRRESALLASLHHPGLAEVLTVGRDQGFEFFAMERIDGVPLSRILRELGREDQQHLDATRFGSTVRELIDRTQKPSERGPRDTHTGTSTRSATGSKSYFEAIVRIVHQVADALHHAHEAGVLHRDVKPSNILVRPNGKVVLTDFGLAREVGRPSVTHSGEFAGTPYYASPEQLVGRSSDLDRRADVFSLGVVLYELATLTRPFEGANSHEVAQAVVTREATDPQRLNRRVPDDLAAITLKALEKSPSLRYQTSAELAADLDAFLNHRPVRARRAGPVRRLVRFCRRAPLKAALATVLLISVPAIGFLSGYLIASQDAVATGEAEMLARQIDELLEQSAMQIETNDPNAYATLEEALRLDPSQPEAFGMWIFAKARNLETDEALAAIENRSPDDNLSHSTLMRLKVAVLQRAKQVEESDELKATLDAPDTATDAFFQGLADLDRGHRTKQRDAFVSALRNFDLAILMSPRQRAIHLHHLAHAAGHAGSRGRAREIAQALSTTWPESVAAAWWAYFVMSGTDVDRAHAHLRHAMELRPENPRFPYSMGTQLMKLGRFEDALPELQRAAALDPNYAEAHANAASALFQLGRYEEALEWTDLAIGLAPERAMFYANRAQALTSLGRQEEAFAALDKALSLDSEQAIALAAMARALKQRDGAEACRKYCEEQIAAGRHAEPLYRILSRTCAELRDFEAALEVARNGTKRYPNSGQLHAQYADVLQRSDPKAALEAAELAARIEPDYLPIWRILGPLRSRFGDIEGGIRAFRRYLQQQPSDRIVSLNLAILLVKAKRRDEALTVLEELVEKAPNWPLSHEHLSRLLTDMGRYDDAIAAAEDGLVEFPGNEGLNVQIAFIHYMIASKARKARDAEAVAEQVKLGRARLEGFSGKRAKDVSMQLQLVSRKL